VVCGKYVQRCGGSWWYIWIERVTIVSSRNAMGDLGDIEEMRFVDPQ